MSFTLRVTAPTTVFLILAACTNVQEDASCPLTGQGETVRMFLPGSFQEAVKASKETGRCLLVKGVGQIVDKLAVENFNQGQC